MKQRVLLVMLCLAILALPLLTCILFGPPGLVVKPEAVYQESVLAANNQKEEM
jgi:hypothetical protein